MRPHDLVHKIYESATPILRVLSIGGNKWLRNDVIPLPRTGPWFSAKYQVLDREAWALKIPSIYFVAGDDGLIRYTGVSRNGVKQRWREAPAIDAQTGMLRPLKELHHSQCWRHLESEYISKPGSTFEVRSMSGPQLASLLPLLGPLIEDFVSLTNSAHDIDARQERLVFAVEKWICSHKSSRLVSWNIAMTKTPLKAGRAR